MSKRKINLESIILEAYGCKDVHDFQRSFEVSMKMVKEICIEACKQILELASENANMIGVTQHDNGAPNECTDFVYVSDPNGPDYGYTVNKQSILDTIKQIEV